MVAPSNPFQNGGVAGPQQSYDSGGLLGVLGLGSGDPSNPFRNAQGNNAAQGNAFGNAAAGQYGANQAGINQSIAALQAQANGQNSVSAMQLAQGQQANLAAQQSMAASANPQNAAMAARNAAYNMNSSNYGLSGQQAVAGLQERNQAQSALGQLQLGQSGQNLQGALGGYGVANQGYGNALGTPQQGIGPMVQSAVGGAAAAAVKSDRRAKTDIKDADGDSAKMLEALKSYRYRYKNEKDGKGEQFGIMAQDLERAGLKSAVIDTPRGKYVDGGKVATASLGLTAALARRVSKLEGDK